MLITFFGKRKVIFFTGHKPFGFVGENIIVILSAYPYDRSSAQIALFQLFVWMIERRKWKLLKFLY